MVTKEILVLNGGGIRGIAHIGALSVLHDLGILSTIKTYAGSSIGGIICVLLICGYTPKKIYAITKKLNYKKIGEMNIDILNFIKQLGINDGTNMEAIFKKLIKHKGFDENITLKEFYIKTNKLLILTTTCLNYKTPTYMSHLDFPEIPLYLAMRMTSAFPLFFSPIIYANKLYCDGGCSNNFPIELFTDNLDKVIAIHVISNSEPYTNITTIELYIKIVFQTFMEKISKLELSNYKKQTIQIKIDCLNPINFGINLEQIMQFYNDGKQEAIKFFSNNFNK